jgi:hypothetical protein
MQIYEEEKLFSSRHIQDFYHTVFMHLLIDVRTSHLSDILNVYSALDWVDIWMAHHPDDQITFLAYE